MILRSSNEHVPKWATDFLINYGRYRGVNGGQWEIQDTGADQSTNKKLILRAWTGWQTEVNDRVSHILSYKHYLGYKQSDINIAKQTQELMHNYNKSRNI